MSTGSKIINCRYPRPSASCRLFCFPWAGGGSVFYSNWGKYLPESVEVNGITLGGRENRYKDPCCLDLNQVLKEVVPAVYNLCQDNKKFAFFGHSFGALMTFEVARILKTTYNIEPVRMIVSGVSAPHSSQRKVTNLDFANMSDKEFIDFLRKLGGTPKEVLQNQELMQLFLPPLRADYCLIGQFEYDHEGTPLFSCPIDMFDGEEDIYHDLEAWKEITSSTDCTITKLPGGHFYLKDQPNMDRIISHIAKSIG